MAFEPYDFDDDDEAVRDRTIRTKLRKFTDFDCATCNANNPRDERFGDGDEVMCFYCGAEFRARVNDEGILRLVEL